MHRTVGQPLGLPSDMPQLLDEHHLVVLGDAPQRRRDVADHLIGRLGSMPDSQAIRLDGSWITDLHSFCRMLDEQMPDKAPTARSLDGVIERLRRVPSMIRRRYVIWEDADVLLESDVALFGQLVNALLSVAAEFEHLDPDPLVLQRVVFLGGDKLGAYAEDETGQFRSWLVDGDCFWDVHACVDRPSVLTCRLDG
jgi:hypothetical protein